MNHRAKEETPYYFAPGKSLFQIALSFSDRAGSLAKVLNLMEPRVKLLETTIHALPDKTCVLSAVAEARSADETAETIRSLVISSGFVLDAEVLKGRDGVLVDTFHNGLAAGGEALVIIRRHAFTRMLDRVYRILGSGGEVLLFEQGVAVGRTNGKAFVEVLGVDSVRKNLEYLRNNLTAQGWGNVSVRTSPGSEARTIVIRDCFECSSNEGRRTGCLFFKGYIVGNTSAVFGREFTVEETKCVLRGGDACEFQVEPVSGSEPKEGDR